MFKSKGRGKEYKGILGRKLIDILRTQVRGCRSCQRIKRTGGRNKDICSAKPPFMVMMMLMTCNDKAVYSTVRKLL